MLRWLRFVYPKAIVFASMIFLPTVEGDTAELVMFDGPYCEWCEAWHEEIGPVYPETTEGQRAPLRIVDVKERRPADLVHIKDVSFTPLFVLIDDNGEEVGRVNGYPGEDFFWGVLDQIIGNLDVTEQPDPTSQQGGPISNVIEPAPKKPAPIYKRSPVM